MTTQSPSQGKVMKTPSSASVLPSKNLPYASSRRINNSLCQTPQKESRKSGARHIKCERADVRSALYMATFSAVQWNQTFKAFFDRLIADGKEFKAAMVAAMRKMITVLNVMIKTKTCRKEHSVPTENG